MSWWSNLFSLGRTPAATSAPSPAKRPAGKQRSQNSSVTALMKHEPSGSGGTAGQHDELDEPTLIELDSGGASPALRRFPRPQPFANLDAPENRRIQLPADLEDRLVQIGGRVRADDLPIPGLSGASIEVATYVDSPNVDIPLVVERIEHDPVLSGEILKIANSAAFGGRAEIESLQLAVVRLGTRRLRDLILSLSIRSSLFRYKNLKSYGEEIWRQTSSVASISRSLALPLRFDPERAQLLGLMKDVGKIPLLLMLRKNLGRDVEHDKALLGRVFFLYHERAGRVMARAWKLSEELCSVAGCHHRFALNGLYPRSAALVSFAHKADLWLTLGRADEFAKLVSAPELDELGVDAESRHELLALARESYVIQHPETIASPDDEPLVAG